MEYKKLIELTVCELNNIEEVTEYNINKLEKQYYTADLRHMDISEKSMLQKLLDYERGYQTCARDILLRIKEKIDKSE